MRKIATVAAGLLLASCQTTPIPRSLEVVETHEAMVSWINPPAVLIWDVTDAAKSPTEGLDPDAMDEAAWLKLQGAARAIEVGSRRMAEADTLRVGAHTEEVAGFANKAEIQFRIDQDPAWFRELSRKMAEHASELRMAATAKDLRRTRDVVAGLGEACQECHTRYWEKPAA